MQSSGFPARAAGRQQVLLNHLRPTEGGMEPGMGRGLFQKNNCSAGDSAAYERRGAASDDIVVVSALRTPITKGKRGGLKDTLPDDMMEAVFRATIQRTGVNPADIGDIVMGSVLGDSSQRAIQVRIAGLLAGIPDNVPVHTVNRQCSSGLQAIASVAASIQAGYYDIGVAGGVESMSTNPMAWDGGVNPKIADNQEAQDCLLPMGMTSENVAERYGITRQQQDEMAARSHKRAGDARASGRFKDEIVPVKTVWKSKEGEEKEIVVSEDDGIRVGVTAQALSGLKPVFKKGGTTTAGNSSQISDGASAVLLMKRSEALKRGLPILGIFRSFAAVGVDPAVMGIGPAVAIPAAVEKAGLSVDDIDVFELNEAFASQATYCVEKLGLDPERVNPNGGAIALGHPLGCTGARATATLLHEMRKRGKAARFGVVSMCIGSGMGAAAVFERGGEIDAFRNAAPTQAQGFLSHDARV
ncbi:3-ketoacyl-CoA thiolase 2, peroxisomal [Coccomyxa viridis]|uniref:acetyl-CoA C-acyltransferase n=1 Tax=Coccomyxa viridis TaxID=1274662 RepID=A0AAV1ID43_9CHLO|nr:3-ketoacyl-CoA thiolase 2, peroxisomal [Coccomyxa viridis]